MKLNSFEMALIGVIIEALVVHYEDVTEYTFYFEDYYRTYWFNRKTQMVQMTKCGNRNRNIIEKKDYNEDFSAAIMRRIVSKYFRVCRYMNKICYINMGFSKEA